MSQLEFQVNESQSDFITKFVDVILPLPLPRLYTYRVPFDLIDQVVIGARVVVQFGRKKILTAVIADIHEQAPEKYEAKYLLELLDDNPVINQIQLRLFYWIADYYMCHIGDVVKAALPSGFKLSSESKIQLNPDLENEAVELSNHEEIILENLREKGALKYDEISELVGRKGINKLLKSLIEKQVILLFEEVKEKYSPKKVKKVRIAPKYNDVSIIETLMEELEKKPKQLDVLLKYLQQIPLFEDAEANFLGLEKKRLLDHNISTSSLKTLVTKGVFEEYEEVISRFPEIDSGSGARIKLSKEQEQAVQQLLSSFESKDITLLHGVTGSGKTEIYIDLIQKVLETGSQVLLLLPEIALTTQIVIRLRKIFGDKMGIYHSRFSDNERVETWNGVISGRFSFVIGVRSAIFLPFNDLGLIIVDEEHDASYKQHEPAPRYQARDVAMVLAQYHQAKVLLGSATPAIESYYHTQQGNWGLVTLKSRYGDAQLPQIIPVENKYANKDGHGSFSIQLLEEIKHTIAQDKQVIIFQNRRGYAPFLICEDCGNVPICENCNVSLTYHQYSSELRCHYCGYTQGVPTNCEACGSLRIKTVGHGTEKIEEDLQIALPTVNIERMDYDTTRKKNGYERIINNFTAGHTNVLVGTQMISKGLDFGNVTLVGIYDADRMWSYPDFRAHERAYQLITQVSGRAGRKREAGRVIIQTNNPKHEVLHFIMSDDYLGFLKKELYERNKYRYPPFTRLVKIIIKHSEKEISNNAALALAQLLYVPFNKKSILGPQEPLINRIRNLFLTEILIKIERNSNQLKAQKHKIRELIDHIRTKKEFKNCRITIDVDPS